MFGRRVSGFGCGPRRRRGSLVAGSACAALLALGGSAGCDGEVATPARVVAHVLVPQGTNPLVGSTRIVFTFQKPNVSTFVEDTPADVGTLTELQYTYTFPEDSATTVLEVTAEDASGRVIARGRSIPFDILAGRVQNIGVLVLTPGTWAVGPAAATLTIPRLLHGAAVVGDGGLMVAGGTTAAGVTPTVEVFDLNAWEAVPGMPSMPSPRSRFAMVALNADQTLLAGGLLASGSVDLWDGPTLTWSSLPLPGEVPDPWVAPKVAELGDGSAILLGGFDQEDAAVGAVVRATATELTAIGTLTGRTDPTVTPVETSEGLRLLIFGGNDGGGPSGGLFDPATGEMDEDGMSPAEARLRHSAARIGPSRVIIAGGVEGDGTTLATHAWLFDAACYEASAGCTVWSDMGPALSSSGGFADASAIGLDPDEEDPRALFVGGVDAGDSPVRDAILINASSGVAARFPLRTPRAGAALVRLPTGVFAVVGGRDSSDAPLASMEFLEPPAI